MFVLRLLFIGLLIALSTVLHVLPLLLVAVAKALLPSAALRRAANPLLTGLAESWISGNGWMWDRFTDTRLQVDGLSTLQRDGHYLVLANHQSWVDILVLQKVFNRRIPLLRFFLKRRWISRSWAATPRSRSHGIRNSPAATSRRPGVPARSSARSRWRS